MGVEIERKFLVDLTNIDYKKYPCLSLEQGYLSTGPVVRVRKENDTYYLTYKGKGSLSREEYNLPLTKSSYEHLLEKADGNIITKNRYLIPYEKYTIELDEFLGKFAPLFVAEVEFESVEEANAFKTPDWFVEDITGNPNYTNASLSKRK